MSIQSELKKDGIEVTKQLNPVTVNALAKGISEKICNTFPYFKLNQADLFLKLCKLDMYLAKMPDGMAEANYFYKNTSIYFNEKIDLNDIEEFAIHECIHYLQEVKDEENNLLKMGLCDYNNGKPYGLGLNEAAVQLMSAKIIGIPKEYVKYFGISFETNSPSYYPLECCLINQLAYLIGENVLFESTLYSDDKFKNKLSNIIGSKSYIIIQNSIDSILNKEEEIIVLTNKIFELGQNNSYISNYRRKIEELKSEITLTFMRTQNLIISSYFDNEFNTISNLEQVENYRKKLYQFKIYLGDTENYTFFNEYYIKKMDSLEKLYLSIESGKFKNPTVPTVVKKNKFIELIKKIKLFFNKIVGTNKELKKEI